MDDYFLEEFSRMLARLSAMLVVFIVMYYMFSQFVAITKDDFISIVKEVFVSAVAR